MICCAARNEPTCKIRKKKKCWGLYLYISIGNVLRDFCNNCKISMCRAAFIKLRAWGLDFLQKFKGTKC